MVYEDAARRDIDLEVFGPCLRSGLRLPQTAHAHPESTPARVILAIYTGFYIYMDD